MFFAAAIGAAAALSYAGEWLSAGDRPQQADAILVLSGDYARSFHAADLYREGFARRIYVSVPARDDQYRLLDEAGIAFPREEEVVRQVLLNRRR